MRDAGVSIASMIQREETAEGGAFIVMTTHECAERAINAALAALTGSASLTDAPMMMPILDF